MRDKFPGYYRPSDEEFKTLWEHATFVFDANVLLNLYRYPAIARSDFLKALEEIKQRIWIPHQVALEYQENRLTVIEDRSKKYDEVESTLREIDARAKQLRQLNDRHPTINPSEFVQDVERLVANFKSELEESRNKQIDIAAEDKLKDSLRAEHEKHFDGKVGDPLNNEALKKLYNEGKIRFERKIPPGFKDTSKNEFYFSDGQMIERKFGDLIVWFQILEEVKAKHHQYLIFVTDDRKDDWWWIHNGQTIGPRPELASEIKSVGCEYFYMYNPRGFLTYAKDYLNIAVQPESITSVEAVSAEQERLRIYVQNHAQSSRAEALTRLLEYFLLGFQQQISDAAAKLDAIEVNRLQKARKVTTSAINEAIKTGDMSPIQGLLASSDIIYSTIELIENMLRDERQSKGPTSRPDSDSNNDNLRDLGEGSSLATDED